MELTQTQRKRAEKIWPRQGNTPWSQMTDEDYYRYIFKWKALIPKEDREPC